MADANTFAGRKCNPMSLRSVTLSLIMFARLSFPMCRFLEGEGLAEAVLDNLDCPVEALLLVGAVAGDLDLRPALETGGHQSHRRLAAALTVSRLNGDIAIELAHLGCEHAGGTHMETLRINECDGSRNHFRTISLEKNT